MNDQALPQGGAKKGNDEHQDSIAPPCWQQRMVRPMSYVQS